MARKLESQKTREPWAGAWPLAVFACWLAVHPYRGIIHDARLYAAQALQGLEPQRFSGDLFFANGSQDTFTIFSAVYRPLIAAIGLAPAHLLLTVVGQAFWLAGLVLLMRRLYTEAAACRFAILAVVIGSADYGGFGVFTYAETFTTPRLFAEALVLGALGLGLGGRWLFATGLIAGAAALHPVMAATGAAVLALLWARKDRWTSGLGAVAGATGLAIALALAHVQPFDRLLAVFDPEWLEIVRRRCAVAFMSRWRWADFLLLAATFAMLAAAWVRAKRLERRLLGAVLLVGVLSCAATLLGADLAGDVLVVNAQPWRALWLAALLANASAGALLWRTAKGGVARELLVAGLAAGALTTLLSAPAVAPALLYLAAATAVILEPRHGPALLTPVRIILRLVACLSLVVVGWSVWSALHDSAAAEIGWRAALGVVALAATGAGLVLRARSTLLARLLLVLGVTAALAGADNRNDWQRFLEVARPDPTLDAFLAGAEDTYWESSPELLWLKQRKASYYSCTQGAGVMFFRATAIDYARRGRALAPLDTLDFEDVANAFCAASGAPEIDAPVSSAELRAVCEAAPLLDTVIMRKSVTGAPGRTWTAPVAKRFEPRGAPAHTANRYYRYDCKDFRPGRG